MAFGRADPTLYDRKFGRARRRQVIGPCDQRGDVEMLHEQARSLDCLLVTPVNQSNPGAFNMGEGNIRHRGLGSRHECRHLWSRLPRFSGPTGAFAYVGKDHITGAFGGDLAKQRRFLRAADRDRSTRPQQLPNTFEFRAAQLAPVDDFGTTTSTLERTRIERYRVFTRTNKEGAPIRHQFARQARHAGGTDRR